MSDLRGIMNRTLLPLQLFKGEAIFAIMLLSKNMLMVNELN